MQKNKLSIFLPFALLLALGSVGSAVPFHVTYLWHMHQPIYYPYKSVNDTTEFNFSVPGVWDGDRYNAYRNWPKDAVQQGADRGMAHAGAQVSYSGSLAENNNNLWGYNSWVGNYRWARNGLKTSLNNPRLDLVGIPFHHSLMPLTSKEAMVMQIRLHKEQYKDVWDTGGQYSKGFWPPECAFAEWIIPALVEEGMEWVIVDNGHLFRTVPDFPWNDGSSCRPNKADVNNPGSTALNSEWVQLQNVWAPTQVLAPWSYQPHYVQHVNPWTGARQKIIAVPAGRYEGNENGRGGYGAFKPENVWGSHVAKNNNAAKPMLILCHSDGDNYGMKNSDAWNGQHGNFLSMCQANADFDHTSVQDYLSLYPPDTNDIIHVEPGSWVGIDGGTPYFEKWLSYEDRSGEMPDMYSWSVLVAGINRVLTAEALESGYTMNDVEWGIGSDTAKAWHYYLNAETSCYWYWDYDRANPWDGNTTRAVNMAITEANKVLARHPGSDTVGPSIFPPQRLPYNPGGKMWNESSNASSDFDVWTFVDDVSSLSSVKLCWRVDLDGVNPVNEIDNEVYAQNAAKVTAWSNATMTASWWPSVKGPNVPDPANRAQRYLGSIAGQHDAMIDYFVEAVDTKGNTNRSDIFHVWVGESTGGGTGPYVEFDPASPDGCNPVTIKYKKSGSPLGAGQVYVHVGRNGWKDVVSPDPAMTSSGDYWVYSYSTPTNTEIINACFNNGSGVWDNNGGNNWSVTVSNCGTNGGGSGTNVSTVAFDPPAPSGCVDVTITYTAHDGPLKTAQPVYIHVGHNDWQDVIDPDPAMTSLGGGVWEYTYAAPVGAYEINCVFNNGAGTWDNNNKNDWKVTVTGCDDITGLVITAPATNVTVGADTTNVTVSGLAEEAITGWLRWSNSLTGGSGTCPAGSSWSAAGIPLAQGANLIVVAGTNQPVSGTTTTAVDSASATAYNTGWTNNQNAGTGFAAWSMYTSTSDVNQAGAFVCSNAPQCNIGTKAWALYANSGQLSEAKRSFNSALTTADVFFAKFENGYIDGGRGAGIALQNAGGETLWQFFFNGGDTNFSITGNTTDIGWTGAGLEISFRLTATNAYSVQILPYGSSTRTITGNIENLADKTLARFRVWNYSAGSGSDYDVFFNDLRVTRPGAGGAGTWYADTVTVTRLSGFVDTDADGMDDAWEQANFGNLTAAHATSDWDQDGAPDGDEFLAGTGPKDTGSVLRASQLVTDGHSGGYLVRWQSVTGRYYDVMFATNLVNGFSLLIPATNLPGIPPVNVWTDIVPGVEQRFYRIRTGRE